MDDDLWGVSSDTVSTPNVVQAQEDLWGLHSLVPVQQTEQPVIAQKATRSLAMEPVTSAIAGVSDLVEQFARARLVLGGHAGGQGIEADDYVGQFANWLVQHKQEFEKTHPYIYAPVEGEGTTRKALREGIRSIIPSLGAGVPGMIVGAIGGVPGIIGGFAASGATIFGLAEYDQFIEDVVKHNRENPNNQIPSEIYKDAALKSAIMEGGLEFVSDAIEAGTFGFGTVLTQPLKSTVSSILKQGWKGAAKSFLLRQVATQPAEILTEMAQNYAETSLRQSIGIDTGATPWQSAFDAVGPTFVSTLLIGAGSHGLDVKQRSKIVKALEDPETDFDTRFNAMKTIYSELQKADRLNKTELANKWGEIAQFKLLNHEGFDLDESLTEMKPLAKVLTARAAEAELKADEQKFLERGQPQEEQPEFIPPEEQKPSDDKQVRQIMGYETRDLIYNKFIEKGFNTDRAYELTAMIMGARGPQPAPKETVPSIILDKYGNPMEKEVTKSSTEVTQTLTPGQITIQKLPETLKNQLLLSGRKETTFTSEGTTKAIIKKRNLSDTYTPFQVAKNEWIGIPSTIASQLSDLAKVTTGQGVSTVVTPTMFRGREQGPTQSAPVTQSFETLPDDLTRDGKPYTNKVSAKLAIQRLYKQIGYEGKEDHYVPYQIAKNQWVARKTELIKPVEVKESSRQYLNRRNTEYLAAMKESPEKGLEKMTEIIQGMEDEGHDNGAAYKQALERKAIIERTIERQKKKEALKNEGKDKEGVATEKQDNGKKLEQTKPNEGRGGQARETSTVVQERGNSSGTEAKGEEGRGEGGSRPIQEKPQKVAKEKIEQIKAKNIIERLKAGEDVSDELVNKFKTVALRWSRDDSGRWVEHEPEYLTKRTLTPEEREQRADQRAIEKAKGITKIKKPPIEEAKKAKQTLLKLKEKLAKTTDEDKREELTDEINSTRQDLKVLASRANAKEVDTVIKHVGEHQLANHVAYQSPEETAEVIDKYTALEPDTNTRMLRRIAPTALPDALVSMMNHAVHVNDKTINLDMVGKFILQLEDGLQTNKLDNYFIDKADKVDFKDKLEIAHGYLNRVIAFLSKPKQLKVGLRENDELLSQLQKSFPISSIDDLIKSSRLSNGRVTGFVLPSGEVIDLEGNPHHDLLTWVLVHDDNILKNNDIDKLNKSDIVKLMAQLNIFRVVISKNRAYLELSNGNSITHEQGTSISHLINGYDEVLYDITDTISNKAITGKASSLSNIITATKPVAMKSTQVVGKLDRELVEERAMEFVSKWPSAPDAIILNNGTELPTVMLDTSDTDLTTSDTIGVQYFDTVYLMLDNIKTMDQVDETIFHEMIGHYGVQRTLGPKFNKTILNVYESYKNAPFMRKIIDAYGFDETIEADKLEAGGEYLAFMANDGIGDVSFWDKITHAVKEIASSFGITFKFSNRDLRVILSNALNYLESSEYVYNYSMPEEFLSNPERYIPGRRPKVFKPDTLRELKSTSDTMQGYIVKDYKKVWITNPKAGEYNEKKDMFQPEKIKVDKIIGTHQIDKVFRNDNANTFVLTFTDGFSREVSSEDFQEMYRKQSAMHEKQYRKYHRLIHIVDYEEQKKPEDLFNRDMFNDAAYATLKTMMTQLPKNQPALNVYAKYLQSPEWYQHPVLSNIVKAAIDRHDRYYELFNHLNEFGKADKKDIKWHNETNVIDATVKLKNKGLTKIEVVKNESSKDYKTFERMVDEIDTGEWKKNYDEKSPVTWEQHYKGQGVSQDIVDLYKLHRAAYDRALDLLLQPMKQLVTNIENDAAKNKVKPKYPEFTTFDENGNIVKINLKQVIQEMGQLRGTYAPRLREQGEWVVKGKRGDKVVRYHKSNRLAAELLKRELERKGYRIEPIKEREKLPEDVYSTLRVINTAKAIENAMNGMDNNSPELSAKFMEELLHDVADMIRMRGFRSSMIKRAKGEIVRGYITDPNERFTRYANNISAGIAKAEAAGEMFKLLAGRYEGTGDNKVHIPGIDPVKEHRVYKTATQYIEEQLRNTDQMDRTIGFVKSVATFKYLGFSLRAPVVNVLSLMTTAPTTIHQYVLNGKGSLLKINKEIMTACVDYAKVMKGQKLKNVDEQLLIDEIQTKGYDTPQYTRDALGTIQRSYSRAWAKTMYGAMYIFGKSEQLIRGATILSAYRLAREQDKTLTHAEAAIKAHDASNKAHGIYGKATQLAVGQGTGPGARLAQILYTYAKFPHNYLQMLYDVGMRKKNIKGFLYGFLSPIILGGAAVVPFKSVIFKFVGALLSMLGIGGDPEKWWWDTFRSQFGVTGERVARHGLMGLINLDVSSSMSIGTGIPKDFYELFGIAGGIYKDMELAKHFLEIGQPGRAIEKILPTSMGNIFKAIRELNGVTTTTGQRVWNESGEPYIPSTGETMLRLAGFRSAEEATMGERISETKRDIADFTDERKIIMEKWRNYVVTKGSPEDLKEIMDDIKEYNDKIIKSGKGGEIPFIKKQSLQSQAKALSKPNKAMTMGLYEQD